MWEVEGIFESKAGDDGGEASTKEKNVVGDG